MKNVDQEWSYCFHCERETPHVIRIEDLKCDDCSTLKLK